MRGFLLVVKFLLTLFVTHYIDFSALGFLGLLTAASIMAPSLLGFGIMYNISRHAVTKNFADIVHEIKLYGQFISVVYAVLLCVCILYGIMYNTLFLAIIAILIVFCEHLNGELYGLFLNLSRPFFANILHFVRSALWAIFYMVAAYFYPEWRSIDILLMFWLGGSVIALVFHIIKLDFITHYTAQKTIKFYKHVLKILKESKIMYANSCVTTLSQYADRYIITAFLGLELTGVYIFFWQFSSALCNLLSTGVIQAYRPKLVRAFKEKDIFYNALFKTCLKKSFLLASFFAVTCTISLYILMPYFNKPLVEAHFNLVYWVLTGFIVSIIIEVLNLLLYSSHSDVVSLKIRIISFLTTIILNILLIYFYGLNGAGMAFLSSLYVQVLLIHFYLKKYHLYHA